MGVSVHNVMVLYFHSVKETVIRSALQDGQGEGIRGRELQGSSQGRVWVAGEQEKAKDRFRESDRQKWVKIEGSKKCIEKALGLCLKGYFEQVCHHVWGEFIIEKSRNPKFNTNASKVQKS